MLITDVTGHEGDFNLQTQGIELVRHESILKDHEFDDEDLVRQVYYQEILDLTRQVLERNPKLEVFSLRSASRPTSSRWLTFIVSIQVPKVHHCTSSNTSARTAQTSFPPAQCMAST